MGVVNAPMLQRAFGTVRLSLGDWLLCTLTTSSVLWLRELGKVVAHARR